MIARALAQEPDILLLDEPTTYLDLYNQQRVLEVMDMLRGQGITLLATLHDPNHALALADHAVTLRRLSEDDSRTSLISSGAPSDIVHAETIRAMYSVQAEFITTQRGPAMLPWMSTVDS
ncbi:ABC transporter ATP-binding protein [Corynebacterium ulcerans]|nr:ABC transporter ATP-binding protein [Corynebacterium ulcerans]